MPDEVVARRYAQAFFELARDAGAVDDWGTDLGRAVETLSHGEVLEALANPRLALADRVTLALELTDGTRPQTRNLVRLLVEHDRVVLLPEVLAEYQRIADRESGVVRARVTTAIPVDRRLQERISTALRQRFGTAVQVELDEDPAIIGGLIIRVGDRIIDTSIRTRLQQLQASLR